MFQQAIAQTRSLCAVAVMALGVPTRAFIRRKKAPRALCEWCKLRAARRRATVTRWAPGRTRRDRTFPPEIWCWGHSPSQLQKCFTLGHRYMSVPISLRRIKAVFSRSPRSSSGQHPPGDRAACGHRTEFSLVFLCRRALGGKGCPALLSAKVSRWALICRSHRASAGDRIHRG